MSITLLHRAFDAPRILQDVIDYVYLDPAFDREKFNWHNQISLRESTDWFEGTGSLYDYGNGQHVALTSDFVTTSSKLSGSYVAQVIKEVEQFAQEKDGVQIGRVRLMRLLPKTCYTLHKDLEEFRYHIPLSTNRSCFFIISDQMLLMPNIGQLYRFTTNEEHTAVNASRQSRTHLVFDTFK